MRADFSLFFLKFSITSTQISTQLCLEFILVKLTVRNRLGLAFASKPKALVGDFQELCSALGLGHPSHYLSGSV